MTNADGDAFLMVADCEILENFFVFLESAQGYLSVLDFLAQGVVIVRPARDLLLDSFEKVFFADIAKMPHYIFDFDSSSCEGSVVDSGQLGDLTYNGGSGRNMKARVFLPDRVNEGLEEVGDLDGDISADGQAHLANLLLDHLIIHGGD